MTLERLNDPSRLVTFGIEIAHSRTEASEAPPEKSARETLRELEFGNEHERINQIHDAASEVNKVVVITRESPEGTQGLIDIFTAAQIEEMSQRIHDYLGKDLDEHLKEIKMPRGYPLYIGRLATHFKPGDDVVTSQFWSFGQRHQNPSENAIGPREENSREYANWANESILGQFESYYQAEFDVTLTGATKIVEGGRVSWERGIAECQFLALDYVRDLLASGHKKVGSLGETPAMTIEDIGDNIANLMFNRVRLVNEVSSVNPILGQQLDNNIAGVAQFTIDVFHRGRMGVPRFNKEPDSARRAIARIETLLIHAASLAAAREDQAEIPVLEP